MSDERGVSVCAREHYYLDDLPAITNSVSHWSNGRSGGGSEQASTNIVCGCCCGWFAWIDVDHEYHKRLLEAIRSVFVLLRVETADSVLT